MGFPHTPFLSVPFRRAVLLFRTTHGCGGFLRRSLNNILIGKEMAVVL